MLDNKRCLSKDAITTEGVCRWKSKKSSLKLEIFARFKPKTPYNSQNTENLLSVVVIHMIHKQLSAEAAQGHAVGALRLTPPNRFRIRTVLSTA
jgi:hypothetical protein